MGRWENFEKLCRVVVLKFRVIPIVLVDGPNVVKGANFDNWRRVGTLAPILNVYDRRDVDELLLIDTKASRYRSEFDYRILEQAVKRISAPLSVGGGVTSVESAARLIDCGADKVVIGTAAAKSTSVLERVASRFGSQALISSIDVKEDKDGRYQCVCAGGSETLDLTPVELARRLEAAGAGELLLSSVSRDGTMLGFDHELATEIAGAISIPMIVAGGAGSTSDFVRIAVLDGISAAAAGSIFLFTETTPSEVRSVLSHNGIAVRSAPEIIG